MLEVIGHTPMVELHRIARLHSLQGRLLAKLDYLNPGFSKKDRIARQIIEEAAATGELSPGQTVVELTSGNTGTGLAIVCAVLGYPFIAVMSAGNSVERARMMRSLGAEVVLVPQAAGSMAGQVSGEDLALVEVRAREVTKEQSAFRADQFVRSANRAAHEMYTGPELWAQAGGQIDAFCEFVGTGGTYAGVTAALKARTAAVQCYIVEPATAAVLAGHPVENANHRIQGGGYAFSELELLSGVPVDGYLQVAGIECAQVGDLAAEQHLTIHELFEEKASLEEAFMELTKDSVEYHTDAFQPVPTGE